MAKNQLSYCSNVHPGESLSAVVDNIKTHFSAVKKSRQLTTMASGLWLSAKAANELLNDAGKFNDFSALIHQQGLLLTSLNGFPYGDFHQKVVKKKVYLPTWAQEERLTYTQQLATILARCLPESVSLGVISTLPLAYQEGWHKNQHGQAITQLLSLCQFLQALEHSSNKQIMICLEMEPDCVLESTQQLVHFFVDELIPAALNVGLTKETVLRYLGCCFDTCHQAVMAEDIKAVLTEITAAGIQIGKIQISNALSAQLTSLQDINTLCAFLHDEKFLHQTKVYQSQALLAVLPDLSAQSLTHTFNAEKHLVARPSLTAKIHYHVPIHLEQFDLGLLMSTQAAILASLDFLQTHPDCQPYLEIETYTWLNFIAKQTETSSRLQQGLLAEFTWLEAELHHRALLTNH